MIFKHLTRVVAVLLFLSLASTQAYATSLGDISVPGWPRFTTDVSATWKNKGDKGFKVEAKLMGGGDMFFKLSPSQSYQVTDGSYKLKADLDTSGAVLGGDIKITGSIAGLKITNTVLFTATLDNFAYDPDTLAFNTTITGGEICIVFRCTPRESVWINLDTGGFNPGSEKFTDTGTAITTIPVPATVWLFGSGILGLASVARRKRKTA